MYLMMDLNQLVKDTALILLHLTLTRKMSKIASSQLVIHNKFCNYKNPDSRYFVLLISGQIWCVLIRIDKQMDQYEHSALRECYSHLESSLDAQAISGTLFSKGMITMELMEELSLVHTTRFQKNGVLLRYLLRNPVPNLISQLCEVLNMEEANRHLAITLQGQGKSNSVRAPIFDF